MKKGENTLLIWVLSWAAVLLGLLYSPLGSPDLYNNRSYFADNQGVNFNKVVIYNVPSSSSENNGSDFSIPLTRDVLKKNLNYAVNALVSTGVKSVRSVNTTATRSLSSNDNSATQAGNSGSGSINEVATGVSKMKSSGSRNSGSIGIGGEMRGLLAFNSSTGVSSSDSTQVQQDTYATTTRQKADENGVPVGDGWKILAVMVVIYSFYKAKKAGLLNFSKNYFSQILSKE